MVPGTRYVDAPATQETGGAGMIYILLDDVSAVREIDSQNCRVLLHGTADWLIVNMSALDFIASMQIATE